MKVYRVFRRRVWKPNLSWPDGYEPRAVSIFKCPVLCRFETRQEAIDYCDERNAIWRDADLSKSNEVPIFYRSYRYEFVEV